MTKRRALLIGIDDYDYLQPLSACGRDATAMAAILSQHHDGSTYYSCQVFHNKDLDGESLTRAVLRSELQRLFASPNPVLFYFSGHGAPARTGGLLCTTDGRVD